MSDNKKSAREIHDFLTILLRNNNKAWFTENKELYLKVQETFVELAESFIERLASFDPTVANLTVKDCTYRIYRDIRFSPDKTPYKTHMGVFVCPGGKKSNHAGYYLHIEPEGKSLIAIGAYMPPKPLLDSIREDVYSRSEEFLELIKERGGLEFDRNCSLKKMPLGFPSDSPMAEYLKLKDFCMFSPLPVKYINGTIDELLDYVIGRFKPLKGFNDFLNRAIEAEE